jgi:hypothetical protein
MSPSVKEEALREERLNARLDRIEQESQARDVQVAEISTAINLIKLEQAHFKELFDARLRVIERTQELGLNKIDQLGNSIMGMASASEKSPAGRELKADINVLQTQLDDNRTRLDRHATLHTDVIRWQNRIEGVLALLKWVGLPAGATALLAQVLHALGILP